MLNSLVFQFKRYQSQGVNMFFIWKGYGILAIGIPIFISIILNLIINCILGDNYYENSNWTAPLALLISAVFVYLLGVEFNHNKHNKHNKIVIDKETKEELILKENHTLFFIPFQYWSIIILILAIYILIK